MSGQGLLVAWIMVGLGGWTIGVRNGRGFLGFVLGFALGLIGLIVLLMLGRKEPNVTMRTHASRW
jgi:hypothetical protein